jgi:3-keto-disaccharide hydrolase
MRLTCLDNAFIFAAAGICLLALAPATAIAQTTTLALDSADGLITENATVEPVTYKGKKGVKVTGSGGPRSEPIVLVDGVEFTDGTIEVEIAGLPRKDAGAQARGFVGISFRVRDDRHTYDCFYLRPTNGRADDQLRRNHSAQYTSHPDWPWNRLRKETPGKYETYVDLAPGEWTMVKVVVEGDKARLYVHGNEQPTLIVNDVKSGPNAKGGVGLWLNASTEAYYRNLKITR